jgi:hypothetical protein
MLYRKIIVYCKNHTENIDTLYGKDGEAVVLNLALQTLTITLAKVNTLEVVKFKFCAFIWSVSGRGKS